MPSEKDIARYEYFEEIFDNKYEEEIIKIREQIIIIKEYSSTMETCIRQIGQHLHNMSKELERLRK